ncbi:hypothetical protein AVEN_244407-1 [Araneus ventricosus]|uniref:Uncharacterized protein n=1 Tax=Araneus ventricosus TaxID=182803 RepID=A0A4Y2IM66_ARAVE|nr:hypothetical protein AVEN_244407-1 [Araneus ventricosus]
MPKHRVRRRKRQFNYENQDEPIIDEEEKCKIEFFYHLLDTAINIAYRMASEIDADKNFESIPKHRVRRRKGQFNYENQNEPIIDEEEKYKIEFFYHLLDTAINS